MKEIFPEEKKLLIAAAQSGIIIIPMNQTGRFVRAGGEDFLEISDPAYATKYLEALESLIEQELVYPESDVYYKLTSKGFEIARKLAKKGGE